MGGYVLFVVTGESMIVNYQGVPAYQSVLFVGISVVVVEFVTPWLV